MKKQTIITIWFDEKGKCRQIIKPTSKFQVTEVANLVQSVTCGNYFKYFTTTV